MIQRLLETRALLGIISAGTANGKVANWKRKKDEKVLEASWKLQAANKVGGGKVLGLSWCPLAPSLAVITDSELVILEEDNIIVRMRNKVIFKSQHSIPNCSTVQSPDISSPGVRYVLHSPECGQFCQSRTQVGNHS